MSEQNDCWIRKLWIVLIVLVGVNVWFVVYLIVYDGLLLPREDYGWVRTGGWNGNERIVLSIPEGEDFNSYVLIHETGHIVYTHLDKLHQREWEELHNDPRMFYVTEYARVDAAEDFAESWAHYMAYRDLGGNKKDFIQNIIEDDKIVFNSRGD